MSTRTKTLGFAAAVAAMAVAVPTAVQAYAEPTTTTTTPATPTTSVADSATATTSVADSATPTTSQMPVASATQFPDPQGSGCDAYKNQVGAGAGSFGMQASLPASQAIANNPDLSTFSAAISGKLNPDVNIASVLDNGPYVVFAPTNAAFEKLDAATLATLKSDPVQLVPTLFYHMVLGYLGPNDVAGKMPTQDGRPVVVTGKGGDIKVNDVKVTCAYTSRGAYIYMIDTVLTPPTPAAEAGSSATSTSATTTSTSATTSATSATSTTETASSASESASTSATVSSTATETPSTATTTTAKPAA